MVRIRKIRGTEAGPTLCCGGPPEMGGCPDVHLTFPPCECGPDHAKISDKPPIMGAIEPKSAR